MSRSPLGRPLRERGVIGVVALVLAALPACRRAPQQNAAERDRAAAIESQPFTDDQLVTIRTLSPLPPVPEDPTNGVSGNDAAAHFGQFLFFEKRLSENGEVSCASCHRPNHGFSVPTRRGHGREATPRHPPSLVNVAYHEWYDWDGKADSLWAQAARPIEHPGEHGTSRTAVARTVANAPELRRAYEAVFGELPTFESRETYPPIARPTPQTPSSEAHSAWKSMSSEARERVNRVFSNLTKAIAAYEERLVSGSAPFDRYVEGLESGDPEKLDAISPAAKRGLALFVSDAGCVRCHNGATLTDGTFHNLGLEPPPWRQRPDLGRWRGVEHVRNLAFNATGRYSDARDGRQARWVEFLRQTPENRGQFKTPTLRNVARTPPYMHGGQFATLEQVVRFYSTLDAEPTVGHREEMLEPLGLSNRQIDDLVAFLHTLTGERPSPTLLSPPDSPVPP